MCRHFMTLYSLHRAYATSSLRATRFPHRQPRPPRTPGGGGRGGGSARRRWWCPRRQWPSGSARTSGQAHHTRTLGKSAPDALQYRPYLSELHLCWWELLYRTPSLKDSMLTHFPRSAAYMRHWIGSALVQIMVCRLFGAKTLSKPMLDYCQLKRGGVGGKSKNCQTCLMIGWRES